MSATITLPKDVQTVLDTFVISHERLVKISEDMQAEFTAGLEGGTSNGRSSIAMLPSFVPALPDGSETGKYVAIDLSGKNLRILLLTLNGAGKDPSEPVINNFIVPNPVMKGTGEQLFNFIVNCLQKFLKEFSLEEANLPIGFVFSYPCQLLSIRSARLLWWTKGFDIKDCLQKDVVELLEEALELNMSTKAKIKAVMNDTVGQLAAAAHRYGAECVAAVVIGYGCNSSYLEDTDKIKKFDAKAAGYNHKKMVIVTEWEEFGAKGELADILTPFDKEIDDASVHRGKQIIDKLTGALYMGDLVRRILAQFVIDRVLFNGTPVEKLDQADMFPTKYILEVLGDESGIYKVCRRICDELEVPNHGSNDYQIIHEVCHIVSQRSASIVASAISALLRHIGRPCVKVGVGGALIQFHPTYHALLEAQLNSLAPLNIEWELVSADEGSAKGAALIAAVAAKLDL
ncbi:hexokinase domain-containing protein [Ditylenchus destructor]|nr:hexokinase domain-containing protein [Ditylenchus destructor]